MLGSTGLLSAQCFGAHALLFGRRSPRWHALAHLLGDDREEQFRFLQRFFFEIPEDAYFIRVLNSGHTYCSFPVGYLLVFETLRFEPIRPVSFGLSFIYPPCGYFLARILFVFRYLADRPRPLLGLAV